MARDSEKAAKGLFGLMPGRRPAPGAPLATPPAPDRSAMQDDRVRRLNIKALAAAQTAPTAFTPAAPLLQTVNLASRMPWIADVASPWFAYWATELGCEIAAQRKLWESAVVLQTFHEAGVLRPDAKVLGFGVGDEALPSYLASIGLHVVATDLPGVTDTAACWKPDLLTREQFEERVEVSDLDMRRLDDATLRDLDACWSCSVLNEMASPEAAADTAILTLDVLRPGGVAVHVTEFAFADNDPVQHPQTLCFTRAFFEKLAEALTGRGHHVSRLDFSPGAHPLDGYIDTEPFGETFGGQAPPHLKILSGAELRTSFALTVRAR